MSRDIDERVVSLEFIHKDFERGIQEVLKSLDSLDKKLDETSKNSGKKLSNIEDASEDVTLATIKKSLDEVTSKFNVMSIAGMAAITNIVNKAVDAGVKIAKSLSVDQITSGWAKYGEKTTNVATLLAQGFDIDTVYSELEKLMWFTDETSYNFSDMTNNISKFTGAGMGLEDSATAMKGIALWAALSGQNATTASSAMYQLSQAISAGTLRREDYKSIQNYNMATKEFQQTLIDAGVATGNLRDNMDGTYTSIVEGAKELTLTSTNGFMDSLTEGQWATTEVMMEAFKKYGSAIEDIYSYAEEHDVTASEAIQALGDETDAFGLKAFKAGQEARTLKDALDSVKDATSTIFSSMFEDIFGKQEQATKLWTYLANSLYDMFASPLDHIREKINFAFNSMYTTEGLNGQQLLFQSIQNLFEAYNSVIVPISEAFKNIFGEFPKASKIFDNLEKFEAFTASLKVAEDVAGKVKEKFEKIFGWADRLIGIAQKLIHIVTTPIKSFITEHGSAILDLVWSIVEAFGSLLDSIDTALSGSTAIKSLSDGFAALIGAIGDGIVFVLETVRGFVDTNGGVFGMLGSVISWIGDGISKVAGFLSENVEFKDIVRLVLAGKITDAAKKIKAGLDGMKSSIDGVIGLFRKDDGGHIKTFFSTIGEALTTFVGAIKPLPLLIIAASVAVLVNSIAKIKDIDPGQIAKGITTLAISAGILVKILRGFTNKTFKKATMNFQNIKSFFSSAKGLSIERNMGPSLISLGVAIALIAGAFVKIAKALDIMKDLEFGQMCGSVLGLSTLLGVIAVVLVQMSNIAKTSKGVMKNAFAILIVAFALKLIANALYGMKDIDSTAAMDSVFALGGTLAAIVGGLVVLTKYADTDTLGVKTSDSLLKAAAAIWIVSDAMRKIAAAINSLNECNWEEEWNSVIALGVGIGIIGAVLTLMTRLSGRVLSNKSIATTEKFFSKQGAKSLEEKITNPLLAASAAIWIVSDAIRKISEAMFSLKDIDGGRLFAIAGSISLMVIAIGGILTAMSAIPGTSGIGELVSAVSLWIVMQGLVKMAESISLLSGYNWAQLGSALDAISILLVEVAAIVALMGAGGAAYPLFMAGELFAAGALWIVMDGLTRMASGLSTLAAAAGANPQGVITALHAMAGMLVLVGAVLSGMSILPWVAVGSLFAGGAIWLVCDGLTNMAVALAGLSALSPEQLALGIVGIAGVLTVINTVLYPELGLIGAVAELLVGKAVSDVMAQLPALATALSSLAGFDAASISAAASGIGKVITSISEALGDFGLGDLFDKTSQITEVVGVLTPLASGIKSWINQGITGAPEGFAETCAAVADGISSFHFLGSPDENFGNVAKWLGAFTTALIGMNNVEWNVSDSFETACKNIHAGIGKFHEWGDPSGNFAVVAGAIGSFVTALKRMNNVEWNVGEDFKIACDNIGAGIQQFVFVEDPFANITNVVTALSSLRPEIAAWKDVSIGDNLTTQLSTLIGNLVGLLAEDMLASVTSIVGQGGVAGALTSLRTEVQAWADVTIPTSLTTDIFTVLSNFKNYVGEGDISGAISTMAASFQSMANAFNELIPALGTDMASTLTTSLNSSFISAFNAIDVATPAYQMMSNTATAISAGAALSDSELKTSGEHMYNQVYSGVSAGAYSGRLQQLGQYLAQGLINGIHNLSSSLYDAGWFMVRMVDQGVVDYGNIASPSKLTAKEGHWLVLGLTNEIENSGALLYDTGKNAVTRFNDGLLAALATTTEIFNSTDEFQPTIRPVLDLSDVKRKAGNISGMFKSPTLSLDRTNSLAADVSIRSTKAANDTDIYSGKASRVSSVVNNFVQNNYSPKALSRADIYRQTKNQFAAMERISSV